MMEFVNGKDDIPCIMERYRNYVIYGYILHGTIWNIMELYHMWYIWLYGTMSGWWFGFNPSGKWWTSSVGMIVPYGKIKRVPNHQSDIRYDMRSILIYIETYRNNISGAAWLIAGHSPIWFLREFLRGFYLILSGLIEKSALPSVPFKFPSLFERLITISAYLSSHSLDPRHNRWNFCLSPGTRCSKPRIIKRDPESPDKFSMIQPHPIIK